MKLVSPTIANAGSASSRIQGRGPLKDQGVAPGNGQMMNSSLEEPKVQHVGSASTHVQGIGAGKDNGVAPGNGRAIISSLEEPTLNLVGEASEQIQGSLGTINDGSVNSHMFHTPMMIE